MWVDCRVLHGVCFINRGLVQLRRRKRKEGSLAGGGEERLISFLKLGYDLSGFRLSTCAFLHGPTPSLNRLSDSNRGGG